MNFLSSQNTQTNCESNTAFHSAGRPTRIYRPFVRLLLKHDGTRAETRFRLSAKRTSPFKSAGGRQFSRLLAAEVCASAAVMLHTPCSKVVWRVLATHCIRQFPLRFPYRVSPCAIIFFFLNRTDFGRYIFFMQQMEFWPCSFASLFLVS